MLQTQSFKQNFDQVIKALEIAGIKPTSLAKKLGYTTTSQLHSVISGESIPSIRAVINLIETLKVNPLFLFLGQGEMFLDGADNISIDNFHRENTELLIKNSELLDKITSLQNRVDELEKSNKDLLDMSSAALKYYKGLIPNEARLIKIHEQDNTDVNTSKD